MRHFLNSECNFISHDVKSGSDVKSCFQISKPLVIYILSNIK